MSAPLRALDRRKDGRPAAPVRLLHLGLGNFFRAHAAWYTEHAPDAAAWGIAAFTGRSPAAAVALRAQDALYTLLVRGPDGARPEVVSSVSAVHAADDLVALRAYFASTDLAVVTATVTEAAYCRSSSGDLDTASPAVRRDIEALAADPVAGPADTVPGRVVAGLLTRRAAGAGALAIVSNDNLPDNGQVMARVVSGLAAAVDPSLLPWIEDTVSFVTTVVDRITPRTTDEDRAEVSRQLDVDDPEVVPTEQFTEWILAGDFPNGRPAWEVAGARFVRDVRPFEQRKLWLLNGAHSLMAYAGSTRGHETVAQAIGDPVVRGWVEEWWSCACAHLELPAAELDDYCTSLRTRFGNAAIRHLLAQIAADGSQKVPVRVVPVVHAGLEDGRVDPGATRPVAGWIAHLRGHGAPVTDVRADEVTDLSRGTTQEAVARVLTWLGVADERVARVVALQVADLEEFPST
ncbi:mannitol dehydrogenase family protein [Allobranchiibius sp. GilTou73]|uniref:mannitol dehydrogenase family protein n=1 Tax=Allobranchiibius sp. GilTou73 TaxID=2904523 RepID=UPI001F2EB1CA|nr:mannitol dehydrogenase family protein [Allobranchiibius sp. GilTou73]UIJ35933.1 mannitol dehydrogenase family protein [Allobranchiibius sp. GilTou73]